MIIGNTLTDIYEDTIRQFACINVFGKQQKSQFGDTIEILNYSCCLDNPRSRFIATENRKHSLKYLIGELIWYLSGERSVERISHYSKFWNDLRDKKGEVNSNYGEKIFLKRINGKSQYQYVIDELKRDWTSRRAIMMMNLIDEDYNQMHETKDFPCTIFFQFLIRNHKLHMFTTMRSNDFIFGFCNDVIFFTILQEIIAVELNIELGKYYHNAISEHLYNRHFSLLNFESADNKKKLMEIFPKIIKDDLLYFPRLKDYEEFIRNGDKNKFKSVSGNIVFPKFTQFVIDSLIKIWKK